MSDQTKRRDPSDLAGEDLSKAPTPATRHPGGGLDDVKDTTQGPTPQTRQAARAGKEDPAASAEPGSDPRTRGRRGGNQDRTTLREERRPSSSAGDSMTRSEEELSVGTRREEAGRARMTKTIETEHVSRTLPVEHEEATITREPIAAGTERDASIGEQTVAMDLQEEVLEVNKRTVPKERVRLDKESHTEERVVEADVRKERVEVEHDAGIEEQR
jgi:uncharacterized protein (TIGR02271 family)